ncbi:MAG TPA: hypothetical protein PLL33_06015, partial [Paracoccus sp. (in: a-proteobacteria)]|nr:hypothetical protein [Paracoccus sp. (in: a-proteobacteria)]
MRDVGRDLAQRGDRRLLRPRQPVYPEAHAAQVVGRAGQRRQASGKIPRREPRQYVLDGGEAAGG